MKEAVAPGSATGSANIENMGAFPREPIPERWGPAALEERRERTRDHLAKIATRRETWINGTGTIMNS